MPDRNLKLIPRNATARQSSAPLLAAGNSVATLLESGVGNCFPGLECDLRNLERRFFPHLECDMVDGGVRVAAVDLIGVAAARAVGTLSQPQATAFQTLAARPEAQRSVASMQGDFGPLGVLDFTLTQLNQTSFGPGRLPSDPWTAIRLLKQGAPVTLRFSGGLTLTNPRAAYLDPDGALAKMFEPGELTQSLCSPWTHDFRDCQCFYWASNHPDIGLPPAPSGTAENDTQFARDTRWERSDRNLANPPVEDGGGFQTINEMRHHEINRDWQKLNFVVERREQVVPYAPHEHTAQPLADEAALFTQLRYAAAVEHAVALEYLVAWGSLRPVASANAAVQDDLRAAGAELLRIAIGEMRHMRAVNSVIRALSPPGSFRPALAVARQIPADQGGFRPMQQRALTQATIVDFIALEAPSSAVDGVYGRIAATLQSLNKPDEQQQTIRTIMAEGEDHWQTFTFIREWLGRHSEAQYLISNALVAAPAANAAQVALTGRYTALLDQLHNAYVSGLPLGAQTLNSARNAMLGAAGIEGAIMGVSAAGFLPTFAPLPDPRFAPIDPPP
jgi:Ferritin-like